MIKNPSVKIIVITKERVEGMQHTKNSSNRSGNWFWHQPPQKLGATTILSDTLFKNSTAATPSKN